MKRNHLKNLIDKKYAVKYLRLGSGRYNESVQHAATGMESSSAIRGRRKSDDRLPALCDKAR